GFQNTTFGDFDFGVLGIGIGVLAKALGQMGIFAIIALLLLVLIVPNFMTTSSKVINNPDEE
ncbi:MAG: PTS ascorbate transporter subunit IIC, partial [Selenomonadaceae bacterium]